MWGFSLLPRSGASHSTSPTAERSRQRAEGQSSGAEEEIWRRPAPEGQLESRRGAVGDGGGGPVGGKGVERWRRVEEDSGGARRERVGALSAAVRGGAEVADRRRVLGDAAVCGREARLPRFGGGSGGSAAGRAGSARGRGRGSISRGGAGFLGGGKARHQRRRRSPGSEESSSGLSSKRRRSSRWQTAGRTLAVSSTLPWRG